MTIFAKTGKGYEEVAARSDLLTPRQRRVLIMVDGRRSVDELREMLPADDLQHTLGMLEEEGLIVLAGVRKNPGGAWRPPPLQGLPSITAFRPLPEPPNPDELEKARNFIINSLRSFSGHYAHLDVIEQACAAATHEELRRLLGPWLHALMQTRDGKRRAEELRAQLLKVI